MPFLIDGYNLLHAMGRLAGPVGPHGLEKARTGLVGLLAAVHSQPEAPVTVVFDARGARPGSDEEAMAGPVHIVFALREEADDRIEWLIAHDSAPKKLIVVSDDRRLQTAAQRRGCPAWPCDEYLRWLNRQRRAKGKSVSPEKPDVIPDSEVANWLGEFADLENDPEVRSVLHSFDYTSRKDPSR